MQIAILGGGFNPPTVAYEKIIRRVLDKSAVDEVWLMPYRQRAFGKSSMAPAEHRLQMAQLMAGHLGGRIQVSTLELERPGPTYTVDTQSLLAEKYPEHTFQWIIGSDILQEIDQWKEPEALREQVRFLCVVRPGYPIQQSVLERYKIELVVGSGQLPDVSSSEVRRRLQLHKPIDEIVPGYIAQYIRAQGLYLSSDQEEA